MTTQLAFKSNTTYVFNHPKYKEKANAQCEVVNWNPPYYYTVQFLDGSRLIGTEKFLQRALREIDSN